MPTKIQPSIIAEWVSLTGVAEVGIFMDFGLIVAGGDDASKWHVSGDNWTPASIRTGANIKVP
jgi:hypothetical protein